MTTDDIINRIGELRTREGLSARELSLRIGKNEAYINRLEYRRNFQPSIEVIKDIAEACNSSLEEFFYYKISEYKNDTMLIEKFKALSQEKKDALLTLLS